ncbi:MAG: hypothetical protein II949_13425 [Prevotella sp.]|nr:hypothetical protein [Prevotella sp.]
MRHFVLMVVAAMMATVSVKAQQLKTVDKDGQPVPYASISSEDGNFIGTTNLDGVLADVKGAEVVSITHVAYQPQKVRVGQGGVVTLDDADFDLPEITVTQKPLVYVQTYYRIFYIDDDPDMPVCYYRAGVLNNSYERKTMKASIDEEHLSACNMGIFKTVLNTVINPYIKRMTGLKLGKVENRMKRNYKEIGLQFTPNGPGKQIITDKFGTVGTVNDYQGERRYSFDSHKLRNHMIQVTGTDKKKAKAEKRDEKKKNREDHDFIVYRIDEQGNYAPEDYVMSQAATSYENAGGGNVNMLMQVFVTDRAYVNKDELKQIKKDNKMKMTYGNLSEFERTHKIPALSETFLKRIKEIVK